MDIIDFNAKTFLLVDNSKNGEVDIDTIFEYHQYGNLVTADYHDGNIRYGKIIAELGGHELHMPYRCMTTNDELKVGKAIAKISFNENNKIKLKSNWEWLGDNHEKGTSEYVEN